MVHTRLQCRKSRPDHEATTKDDDLASALHTHHTFPRRHLQTESSSRFQFEDSINNYTVYDIWCHFLLVI